MSPFYEGLPVMCIDARWEPLPGNRFPIKPDEPLPRLGAIYVIRTVEFFEPRVHARLDARGAYLRFMEFIGQISPSGLEAQFEGKAFRPLTKRELAVWRLTRITPDTPIPGTLDPNPRVPLRDPATPSPATPSKVTS